MARFNFKIRKEQMLADIISPVSLFLRLRDEFTNTLLLESSDYHGSKNSKSFICFQPLATFELNDQQLSTKYLDDDTERVDISKEITFEKELQKFLDSFSISSEFPPKEVPQGVFGYMNFEAVQCVEDIKFRDKKRHYNAPDVRYQFFRFVICIDHFSNELSLYEFEYEQSDQSLFTKVLDIIHNFDVPSFPFEVSSDEKSNFNDKEFLEVLSKGKAYCQSGDVFQIVLSRRFESDFKGDEFNVYRALRSINPSPYLFYFDYGSYKIFGSSPEAQIVIENGKASIYPIAGTFRRTGADDEDRKRARELSNDPKENSEHIMLVDLARNDLSRHGENVEVASFKEIQFYSHVIHLVSEVTAKLKPGTPSLKMIGDTFPAGTLSGAPKYRAMELIDELEPTARGYYGGAIGFLGLNGDYNHAIMIRSFFSQNNSLTYQAGAGVVAKSNIESELNEVNNKLAALRSALTMAATI